VVGKFLLQHKSLMGPVAGAVIILFGLHLVGWLIKLPVTAGLVIGGVLAFRRRDPLAAFGDWKPWPRGDVRLGAIALSRTHFSCRAITDSLAESRCPLP